MIKIETSRESTFNVSLSEAEAVALIQELDSLITKVNLNTSFDMSEVRTINTLKHSLAMNM